MKYETPSASTIKELAGEMGFTVDDATAEEMRTFWAPFSDAFKPGRGDAGRPAAGEV